MWLLALSIAPGVLFASELTGIRLSSGPLSTRIVLDLDRAASHKLFELTDPNRIVIDLPGMSASSALRLPVPKGRVRSVRTGTRPGGELRVVLDLTSASESKSFLLPPDGGAGHRLVIDLSDRSNSTASRTQTDRYTGRDVVIVIDAGHGGSDPGAIGRSGLREKDVTLDIARRFASLVEQAPGMRPVLVRSGDADVALADRPKKAREARADFFISIHADAIEDRSVRGATVYSIEDQRAAREQNRFLADRGTAAELIGGINISEQDETIARVLLNLSQEVSISNSIIAGDRMIVQLGRIRSMLRPGVQEKSLKVLTSPDIPSLLIETGFISNASDEAQLKDPAFRDTLARALFAGMLDYYRINAPSDSYLSRNPPPEQRGPIRHVITSGETLSEIAEWYRISLNELRRTNEIRGDVIRIGQVLTIPTTT